VVIGPAGLRDAALRIFPELAAFPPGTWLVGGAVRDLLLGAVPLDADLAAGDVSEAAREFARTQRTRLVDLGGADFQTLRLVTGGRYFDLSRFEGDSIEIDLLRRDFTVNAIALELATGQLADPTGGLRDVELRLVRMIRPSNFDDDPLRVVRGVRLAVSLGFEIDGPTMEAMHDRAEKLAGVAPERVTWELDLLLGSHDPARGMRMLTSLGLDRQIFGEELPGESLAAIERGEGEGVVVRYAAIMWGWEREEITAHAQRWRWSERRRRETAGLVELARLFAGPLPGRGPALVALFDAGETVSCMLPSVLGARGLDDARAFADALLATEGARIFSLEPLLDGGGVSEAAGIPPGPEVGALKRAVVEAQVRGEITTPEEAVALVRRSGRRDQATGRRWEE
jgi:hypothetical protein